MSDIAPEGSVPRGVEPIMDGRIEILVTDINMPGMDGYELAEKAKRVREGLKVIALSGREQDASGLPLIRKPFLAQDLKAVMAQHTGLCGALLALQH